MLAVLLAYPLVRDDGDSIALIPLAGAAPGLFLLGVAARASALVAAALAVTGAEYAVFLLERDARADASAIAYAAGLVATAELAYSSLEREAARVPSSVAARRFATTGATAAGAGLLALLVLASSELRLGAGLGIEAVGVAAAAVIAATLAWLATQRP